MDISDVIFIVPADVPTKRHAADFIGCPHDCFQHL